MLKKIGKSILVLLLVLVSAAFVKFKYLSIPLDIKTIQPYLTQSQQNKATTSLTYLGCAGFILQHNGQSIICDPYISNPGLLEIGKMHLAWKEKFPDSLLKSVNMITISHGHYDHCYDIEDLCRYVPAGTKIIGDASVQYQLNAIYSHPQLQKIALDFAQEQEWQYNTDSTFRIFPLQSIHSPHIGKIELLKGKYANALPELPKRAWQWKKGEAFSFLIDILDKKQSISYRFVLINGNLNDKTLKTLKQLCAERKADYQLQIFWKEKLVTENMMQVYAAVQPKEIILHHWNNFFISHDKPIEYFRDAHLPVVLEKYNQQSMKMSTMLPFSSVQL